MKKHLPKIKEFSKKAIGKMIMTTLVVLTVGGTIWAIAAFTEPTSGPAASVQDFAKNILGANNANNAFDSSAVVSNADGSIVERLEALESKSIGYVQCYATCVANNTYPTCTSGYTKLADWGAGTGCASPPQFIYGSASRGNVGWTFFTYYDGTYEASYEAASVSINGNAHSSSTDCSTTINRDSSCSVCCK